MWYEKHGRKGLPWHMAGPYGVWISEIMLQQTQVSICIPYYKRFITKFPNVESIASASIDSVLESWAGLGYYLRARNIYATALLIIKNHNGKIPDDIDSLIRLPGIGRSTAGAICSLGHRKYGVILEANVKRVVARLNGINEDPRKTETLRKLWGIATQYTPLDGEASAKHCQAIMDFGSLLCIRIKPKCSICPFVATCQAFLHNQQDDIPKRLKRLKKRKEIWFALEIKRNDKCILLTRRPNGGIWGGMYCLPIASSISLAAELIGLDYQDLPNINEKGFVKHNFSHFSVVIHHYQTFFCSADQIKTNQNTIWYQPEVTKVGVPVPIIQLIKRGAKV